MVLKRPGYRPVVPLKRIFFSLKDLSQLAGISKGRILRLLQSANVPIQTTGPRFSKRIVYLSDLERCLPEFMDGARYTTNLSEEDEDI